mgnify:CR=1 FL=1
MASTVTEQQAQQMQELWLRLLNGSVTPDEALRLASALVGPDIAKSWVTAGVEQRKSGLANGASWAQPPSPTTQPGGGQPVGPLTQQQGQFLGEEPRRLDLTDTAHWSLLIRGAGGPEVD